MNTKIDPKVEPNKIQQILKQLKEYSDDDVNITISLDLLEEILIRFEKQIIEEIKIIK